LLVIQVYLASVSLTLAAAAHFGFMNPALLLSMTFAGGVGLAFMGPPWQATAPELVPREELRAAVALNSLGVNVARAIGPALGGLVLALAGAALAYFLDAASYIAMIAALLVWRRRPVADPLRESFAPALAAGVRYLLGSPDMIRVLVRAAAFFIFASAYWALLPLVARGSLSGGASLYGVLLGAVGAGAVVGALLLPAASRGRTPGAIVFVGAMATAGSSAVLALTSAPLAAAAALLVAGVAWIAVLTTLNVTAQTVLPDWVRSRGLAIYLTVFFGSMTFGSAVWGQAAAWLGVSGSLLLASGMGAVAGVLSLFVSLPAGRKDLTPYHGWTAPEHDGEGPAEGPVAIEIRYEVAPSREVDFLAAVRELGRIRARDGAYGWSVNREAPGSPTYVERFHARSLKDHLRQHERFTRADAAVQALVHSFHSGPSPPQVSHRTAPGPSSQT